MGTVGAPHTPRSNMWGSAVRGGEARRQLASGILGDAFAGNPRGGNCNPELFFVPVEYYSGTKQLLTLAIDTSKVTTLHAGAEVRGGAAWLSLSPGVSPGNDQERLIGHGST